MNQFTDDQLQKFARFYRACLEADGSPVLNTEFGLANDLHREDLKFIVCHRADLERAAREAGLIEAAA